MFIIAVDIGNTNIVAGIYKGEKLVRHFRIETNIKNSKRILKRILGDISLFGCVPNIAISSVVPSLNKVFNAITKKELNKKAFFINHKVNLGMKVDVDNPSEVGADRLVNAVAAKTIYRAPAVIIDFGTATTVDVVSKEGNYIGGIIAPGVEIGADALFNRTAKLPRVKVIRPKKIIGRNTINCIQSGLIYGTVGGIELFVKKIKNELKYNFKVIATGGLVNLIAGETDIIDYVDEFLTLKGIRIIYEINK